MKVIQTGAVDSISSTEIVVGGTSYIIDSSTEIKDIIAGGETVKVHCATDTSGTLTTTEIELPMALAVPAVNVMTRTRTMTTMTTTRMTTRTATPTKAAGAATGMATNSRV